MMVEKCFACGKALKSKRLIDTRDAQTAYVGPECFKRIKDAGNTGWQPPRGGPRLYLYEPSDAEIDAYIHRLAAADMAAGIE